MRERAEKALKIICWLLVAVLLFQLVRAIVRNHPFAHVTIPAVPTLSSGTNATPAAAPNGPAPSGGGTNHPPLGTNQAPASLVTNLHPTNLVLNLTATNLGANHPVIPATNSLGQTNSLAPTNSLPATVITNSMASTNTVAQTNSPLPANSLASTNSLPSPGAALTNSDTPGTNGAAASSSRKKSSRSGSSRGSLPGSFLPGMGMGQPLPELPPVVRARIDKIVDSELLGPVIRPQPMALLGIAGNVAFLRSASGETGLVKEGDSLGDLKLIRIGINRVLVEQNGQKQELTIFSGMGGESLLTTPDNNSNETTNH
jgi:hypothetical protein